VQFGLEALLRAMEEPCRVEAVLYADASDPDAVWKRSYLTSLRLPVSHIEYCFGDHFERLPAVPAARADNFNTCLHWPDGFPDGAQQLIGLLGETLALPTQDEQINLAMAPHKT
jgi:hypothetical protein